MSRFLIFISGGQASFLPGMPGRATLSQIVVGPVFQPWQGRREIMSKGLDKKKSDKKEPAKTMKEKKADKKIKKAEKK
ncbi:MAG: hypothetical protein NDI73_07790 [Desulfuromonadales bacterium]|nr:hypothetical protein [Desulfuromonadales bacterium]